MKTITLTPEQESTIRMALYSHRVHMVAVMDNEKALAIQEINEIYDILNNA